MVENILNRPILLVLILVSPSAVVWAQQQQHQACNVCNSGFVDASKNFGSMSCGDWFLRAQGTPDGIEPCTLHRMAGVHFCGCSATETFDTCYLCGDAESNALAMAANADKYIPDSPDGALTCADFMETPIVDEGGTCPLLQEKYQRWCGCPTAQRDATASQVVPCPFCESGGNPNIDLEYPFADGSGRDCSQLNDWYQVQTASSCPTLRQADEQLYLIDMQAYCQCPNHQAPNICQGPYCPSGEGIPTDRLATVIDDQTGITCGDNSFLMKMMNKPQDCELLFSTASMCCSSVPEDVHSESTGVFEATGGMLSTSSSSTTAPTNLARTAVAAISASAVIVMW